MARFGIIPVEPPGITSLDDCCPVLQRNVPIIIAAMVARGYPTIIRETTRTNERQVFLHGFGRQYDDGRGIVTNVPSQNIVLTASEIAYAAMHSWHYFGTAIDMVHASLEDSAPAEYWDALAEEYERVGMVAGRRWIHMRNGEGDPPHGQLGPPMAVNPTSVAINLYAAGGNPAVWRLVGGLAA